MSQLQLFLRPPPNVDFVHGYPGIPPDTQRPGASAKGALEIRTPASGISTKWVRIELRKVECLPFAGPQGTFHDTVGAAVNLWDATKHSASPSKDGAAILQSHDFPFQIRIPEAIPPSITLENRAGIRYELVAVACLRGKRSWFRKRKSTMVTTSAAVTIDKHELHSTWGVYSQSETRQIRSAENGVALVVERDKTCYGPGDKMTVVATLKADPATAGSSPAGGAHGGVILRGFEITLKETTIFRPSPTRAKEKVQPTTKMAVIAETKLPINTTIYPSSSSSPTSLSLSINQSHTTTTINAARHIDITYVLSVTALLGTGGTVTMDLPVVVSNWQRSVSTEAVRRIGAAVGLSLTTPPAIPVMRVDPINGRGAHTRNLSGGANRTFAGSEHTLAPQHSLGALRKANAAAAASGSANAGAQGGKWLTAEDEKVALEKERFDAAKRKAAISQAQAASGRPISPGSSTMTKGTGAPALKSAMSNSTANGSIRSNSTSTTGPKTTTSTTAPAPVKAATPPPKPKTFLTADEEKAQLRRYEDAQAKVQRNQAGMTDEEALLAQISPEQVAGGSGSGSGAYQAPVKNNGVSGYMTAEQEKASLRLYNQAKQAVDRVASNPQAAAPPSHAALDSPPLSNGSGHGSGQNGIVPYDALYPVKDAPTQLSEKARMQKAYEERDRALQQQQQQQQQRQVDIDAPPYEPPSPPAHALAEKEMLRLRDERMNAPVGVVRSNSRPLPGPNKVLTAAEEKKMLKEKWANEGNGNGNASPPPPAFEVAVKPMSVPPPPPLMPKPPVEYIRETREVDARINSMMGPSGGSGSRLG